MKDIFTTIGEKSTLMGRVLYIKSGKPLPLGASISGDGINFSFVSKNGVAAKLAISLPEHPDHITEIPFDPHQHKTGNVWHIFVANLPAEFCYAFRVDGEYAPEKGFYFNENNLLLDPYATALTGGEEWGKHGTQKSSAAIDRNKAIRWCLFKNDPFDWEHDKPINRSLRDSIIYEIHVRGFTFDASSAVSAPGTFQGIIEKIPYLRELGVTAVELMPINEFDENECMFTNPVTGEKLKNFWGYSSIGFFAPKASYAASAPTHAQVHEFKTMVKELHRADIEVILDVVFNHTAEGNEHGPTISFRGLENTVYYILHEGKYYKNFSGCGNTLNCNHPVVRELILDCLRYWVTEMHVDGFRFDLASILGRDHQGHVLANPPILEAIAMDPVLANTKIIAEAWDAAGLYQVGHFPAWQRWAEWNDKFRDCVRRFVVGEHGMAGEMATRIAGSSDLYGPSERKPYHSINYVSCHDGFTMYDLVAYNGKHNEENGEGGYDGHNANYSWNCGAEGDTTRVVVNKLRKQQMKNFFSLLMVSQGTPMLLGGDEFARTQRGNNNAYCQDSPISWVDWKLKETHADLFRFVKELIQFRKDNESLRRETFFTGEKAYKKAFPDISWHGVHLDKPDFSKKSKCLAFLISGQVLEDGLRAQDIYVAVNNTKRSQTFKLPSIEGRRWYCKVDTYAESPNDIFSEGNETLLEGQNNVSIKRHSLIILVGRL